MSRVPHAAGNAGKTRRARIRRLPARRTALPKGRMELDVPLRELDPAAVRELWSRTYNQEGKPDWSHLFPYYHPQLIFQDSIQRIEGIGEFKAMCRRLARRCETLRMDIGTIVRESNVIYFDWKMTMTFRRMPSTPVYGCTKLTLHADGRIVEQRDYYDLWGDIFNGILPLRKPYRAFMRRLFG